MIKGLRRVTVWLAFGQLILGFYTAKAQFGYQTTYDNFTNGLLISSPGSASQDNLFDNGVPGTFTLIESTNSLSGNALQLVTPVTVGNGGEAVARRPLSLVNLASNPVVTLSASFYAHTDSLTNINPYSASVNAIQQSVGDAIAFYV